MPTINQLIRNGRKKVENKSKSPDLQKCSHKKGVCLQVMTRTPKKTKFCIAKSSQSQAIKREGNNCLYSRRGT